MDLYAALRAFVRIVERGSMTAAARDLGVSQPAVSKLLRTLEVRTGGRLLERNARALRLTAPGAALYESVREAMSTIDAAVEAVRDGGGQLGGRLRLHGPVCLGERHLHRIVASFQRLYPSISVDLTLGNAAVDLVGNDIDLCFRMARPTGLGVVARRVGAVERLLVASPAYLSRRGPVRDGASLASHDLLVTGMVMSERGTIRLFKAGVAVDLPVRPVLTTNSAGVLVDALTAGQGVGVAQALLVAEELRDGRLVRVLPDYDVQASELFLCYPSARHLRPAVRALIDFAVPALRQVEGISPGRSLGPRQVCR